jgi:hypothetical protein
LTSPCPQSLTLVRSFAHSLMPHRPATGTATTSADFSLQQSRRAFTRKARSPQVRTHTFIAQPPHLRHLALVTRASWFLAHSPCSATPSMRFLFIGSRFTLHASFPHSVALMQLRFALLTVTSSQQDLHPQVCAHAGRTKKKPLRQLGGFCFRSKQPQSCWLDQKVWRRPTANKSLFSELFFTLACW